MSFKILTVDFLSEDAPRRFVRSLRDTGFAIIKNHPIPKDLLNKVYKNLIDFFNSKNKHYYPFLKQNPSSYFPFPSTPTLLSHHNHLHTFSHLYPVWLSPLYINYHTKLFYGYMIEFGEELLEWIDQCSTRDISKKFSVPLYDMMEDSEKNMIRVIQ